MDGGIYFLRTHPQTDLPEDEMTPIHSTPRDIKMVNRPTNHLTILSGSIDLVWGTSLLTCQSFGGVMIHLTGGPVSYKAKLQPAVAVSSTEAEFMMVYDASCMSLHLCSLCYELRVPQDAATIL